MSHSNNSLENSLTSENDDAFDDEDVDEDLFGEASGSDSQRSASMEDVSERSLEDEDDFENDPNLENSEGGYSTSGGGYDDEGTMNSEASPSAASTLHSSGSSQGDGPHGHRDSNDDDDDDSFALSSSSPRQQQRDHSVSAHSSSKGLDDGSLRSNFDENHSSVHSGGAEENASVAASLQSPSSSNEPHNNSFGSFEHEQTSKASNPIVAAPLGGDVFVADFDANNVVPTGNGSHHSPAKVAASTILLASSPHIKLEALTTRSTHSRKSKISYRDDELVAMDESLSFHRDDDSDDDDEDDDEDQQSRWNSPGGKAAMAVTAPTATSVTPEHLFSFPDSASTAMGINDKWNSLVHHHSLSSTNHDSVSSRSSSVFSGASQKSKSDFRLAISKRSNASRSIKGGGGGGGGSTHSSTGGAAAAAAAVTTSSALSSLSSESARSQPPTTVHTSTKTTTPATTATTSITPSSLLVWNDDVDGEFSNFSTNAATTMTTPIVGMADFANTSNSNSNNPHNISLDADFSAFETKQQFEFAAPDDDNIDIAAAFAVSSSPVDATALAPFPVETSNSFPDAFIAKPQNEYDNDDPTGFTAVRHHTDAMEGGDEDDSAMDENQSLSYPAFGAFSTTGTSAAAAHAKSASATVNTVSDDDNVNESDESEAETSGGWTDTYDSTTDLGHDDTFEDEDDLLNDDENDGFGDPVDDAAESSALYGSTASGLSHSCQSKQHSIHSSSNHGPASAASPEPADPKSGFDMAERGGEFHDPDSSYRIDQENSAFDKFDLSASKMDDSGVGTRSHAEFDSDAASGGKSYPSLSDHMDDMNGIMNSMQSILDGQGALFLMDDATIRSGDNMVIVGNDNDCDPLVSAKELTTTDEVFAVGPPLPTQSIKAEELHDNSTNTRQSISSVDTGPFLLTAGDDDCLARAKLDDNPDEHPETDEVGLSIPVSQITANDFEGGESSTNLVENHTPHSLATDDDAGFADDSYTENQDGDGLSVSNDGPLDDADETALLDQEDTRNDKVDALDFSYTTPRQGALHGEHAHDDETHRHAQDATFGEELLEAEALGDGRADGLMDPEHDSDSQGVDDEIAQNDASDVDARSLNHALMNSEISNEAHVNAGLTDRPSSPRIATAGVEDTASDRALEGEVQQRARDHLLDAEDSSTNAEHDNVCTAAIHTQLLEAGVIKGLDNLGYEFQEERTLRPSHGVNDRMGESDDTQFTSGNVAQCPDSLATHTAIDEGVELDDDFGDDALANVTDFDQNGDQHDGRQLSNGEDSNCSASESMSIDEHNELRGVDKLEGSERSDHGSIDNAVPDYQQSDNTLDDTQDFDDATEPIEGGDTTAAGKELFGRGGELTDAGAADDDEEQEAGDKLNDADYFENSYGSVERDDVDGRQVGDDPSDDDEENDRSDGLIGDSTPEDMNDDLECGDTPDDVDDFDQDEQLIDSAVMSREPNDEQEGDDTLEDDDEFNHGNNFVEASPHENVHDSVEQDEDVDLDELDEEKEGSSRDMEYMPGDNANEASYGSEMDDEDGSHVDELDGSFDEADDEDEIVASSENLDDGDDNVEGSETPSYEPDASQSGEGQGADSWEDERRENPAYIESADSYGGTFGVDDDADQDGITDDPSNASMSDNDDERNSPDGQHDDYYDDEEGENEHDNPSDASESDLSDVNDEEEDDHRESDGDEDHDGHEDYDEEADDQGYNEQMGYGVNGDGGEGEGSDFTDDNEEQEGEDQYTSEPGTAHEVATPHDEEDSLYISESSESDIHNMVTSNSGYGQVHAEPNRNDDGSTIQSGSASDFLVSVTDSADDDNYWMQHGESGLSGSGYGSGSQQEMQPMIRTMAVSDASNEHLSIEQSSRQNGVAEQRPGSSHGKERIESADYTSRLYASHDTDLESGQAMLLERDDDDEEKERAKRLSKARRSRLRSRFLLVAVLLVLVVLIALLINYLRELGNDDKAAISPSMSLTNVAAPSASPVLPSSAINTSIPTPVPVFDTGLIPWTLIATMNATSPSVEAVSISKSLIVAGEPLSGSVRTFYSSSSPLAGAEWLEGSVTTSPTSPADSRFGAAIDLVSERMLVGAPSTIAEGTDVATGGAFFYVYKALSKSWEQLGEMLRGDDDIVAADNEEFGSAVSASNTFRAVVGAPSSNLLAAAAGRVYTFDYSAATSSWDKSEMFPIIGESAGDRWGTSVALAKDGSRFLGGAPGNGVGYARMYSWLGSNWQLSFVLRGQYENESFGMAVAVLSENGEYIAIGAPGYEQGAGRLVVFQQQASSGEYTQLGPDIVGEIGDGLGLVGTLSGSIGLNGPMIVASTQNGRVKRFDFDAQNSSWVQKYFTLTGVSPSGAAVAFSTDGISDTLVIGSKASGQTTIYDTDSLAASNNSTVATLYPSTNLPPAAMLPTQSPSTKAPALGTQQPSPTLAVPVALSTSSPSTIPPLASSPPVQQPLSGSNWVQSGGPYTVDSAFGTAISTTNRHMALGTSSGADSGSVFVFPRDASGSLWSPTPSQQLIGTQLNGNFGAALDTHGDILLVGAPGVFADNSVTPTGAAYFYQRASTNGEWAQFGPTLRGELGVYATDERFGASVSVSSVQRVAVGAPGSSVDLLTRRGRVYVYEFSVEVSEWILIEDIVGGVQEEALGSAIDISTSGNFMIVGAPGNGAGFATVYQYNPFSWLSITTISGEFTDESMGSSVKVLDSDGFTIAAGGPGFDSGRGRVVVYERNPLTQQYSQLGGAIVGEPGERIGSANLLSGGSYASVVVVVVGTTTGQIKRFEFDRSASAWVPTGSPINTGYQDGIHAIATSEASDVCVASGTTISGIFEWVAA